RAGVPVLRGELSQTQFDRDSGDQIESADFSALREPGDYELVIDRDRAAIHIDADPYAPLLRLTLLGFRGQRCGTEVNIGAYGHAACHTTGAYHPSSGRAGAAPSVHGWHDAGDYG